MKYVYHGSSISGLKIIRKNKSTHSNSWVYGSYNEVVPLIFLSQKGNDLYYHLSGSGTKEDPIKLVERKEGMFEKIFNVSGSIYKLNATNFKENKTGWSAEVVSSFDEEVIEERIISCAFDELKGKANKGELDLYLYPDRPKNIPIDNSDLIPKVLKWRKNGFDDNIFLNLYPELKNKYLYALKNEI